MAAAALLTDYILTVAVSVAAGVLALTSIFPALFSFRVIIGGDCIVLLSIGNLRGARESASIFALPTYGYIFLMLGVLGYGLFRDFPGTLPQFVPPTDWAAEAPAAIGPLLVLRAFASGAVALADVEAVSDGVRAL